MTSFWKTPEVLPVKGFRGKLEDDIFFWAILSINFYAKSSDFPDKKRLNFSNLHVVNTQPIILFDGVCNLCNRSVQFVIRHDTHASFLFASLQCKTGKELLQQYGLTDEGINSFVLIQHNRAFTKSTAALLVSKQLSGPIKLLYAFILVPTFIRDAVYKLVAKNRYKWFGRQDSCMIPDKSLENRFLI